MTWSSASARCEDAPIKVGILHSQTGADGEQRGGLADTIRMLIEQQNAKGGLLGRKLEPVIADPASDADVFQAAAEKMLSDDKVAAVFGGWTSSSRRSMLPVFEKHNGLLFYPVQFEGQESSRNIFYTGAVPNQQMLPALRYLASKQGGSIKRWFLLGTDYVYPRTANAIIEAYLRNTGVADEDIVIRYVPFTVASWEDMVGEIRGFAASGRKTAVISTVNGDSNSGSIQELGKQNDHCRERSGDGVLDRRARTGAHAAEVARGAHGDVVVFLVRQITGERRVRQILAAVHGEEGRDAQRSDGSGHDRISDVDPGGHAGGDRRRQRRSPGACTVSGSLRRADLRS